MAMFNLLFVSLVGNPSQGCPVCGDYHCPGCYEDSDEERTCLKCIHYDGDLICSKFGPLPDDNTDEAIENTDLKQIAERCGEYYL